MWKLKNIIKTQTKNTMIKQTLFVLALILSISLSAQNNQARWLRYGSISPDGKNIAFAYAGDIYKISTTGGNALALTSNSAYDFKPIWSPDSKTIAFASDRNGNFDIYTIASQGGKSTRVSFFSGKEIPNSISPDGKNIIFSAHIADSQTNAMFPSSALDELYSLPLEGGRETQIISSPAKEASYSKDSKFILYENKKGYENTWRKHHTSSVTRDICIYDTETKTHKQITNFAGEDLNPVFNNTDSEVYFLSEKSGSLNVWKKNLETNTLQQITHYKNHPVRFLSIDNNNTLCYAFDGDIYTKAENLKAQKLEVSIISDKFDNTTSIETVRSGAREMSVSPNGKEVAFIVRGEVFVTSVEYGTTKRITNTPEQERSVSFSPDGKALLYASERNASWNLYQTTIVRKEEKHFANATLLKEEVILDSKAETFQAQYSPDGKEIAFLEERTNLRVINLKTKKVRTILSGKWNYSYTDGDQHYQWSPDSKWFLVDFIPHTIFVSDVALVSASGDQKIINLNESGYSDGGGKWAMNGKAMIWSTDKNGFRSHGSWGARRDIYAQFFSQKAYDDFKLTKEERELKKEIEKEIKDEKDKKKDSKKDNKKDKKSKKDKKAKIEDLNIEFNKLEDLQVRLTINSSSISDALLTPDGKKLFYLSRFESSYDLWVNDFEKHETKKLLKLTGGGGNMQFDKAAKYIFMMSGRSIIRIDTKSNKKKTVSFSSKFELNHTAEREYMFEHVWRQMKKKFYDPELQNVNWDLYKTEYHKFLPYINNNYDFAELLSEMLGEMNASHTGASYRPSHKNRDATANLGAFYDNTYSKDGLLISEIIEKGPLDRANTKIKAGIVIEKIDGIVLSKDKSIYPLLNHKANKKVLLSLYNPKTSKRWDETVSPCSPWKISSLVYKRWVKQREAECEKISNGRIGYVHVKGMNSYSFRDIYSKMLGKYGSKEAIIVDTRFNGGGWLHDDLVTLLSGKKYVDFCPRGQFMGSEPMNKWHKPSAVIMCEGNYSDASGFPYAYKALGIGKLVGMPVAGTMTAVWWESLIDNSVVFGIPQVGLKNAKGEYLENQEIIPDFEIKNQYFKVTQGEDEQLRKTVEVLLEELK